MIATRQGRHSTVLSSCHLESVRRAQMKKKYYCVVCGNQCERKQMPSGKWTKPKTCSDECLSKLLSQQAKEQMSKTKDRFKQEFERKFNDKYAGRFVYVGGYEWSESIITCKCLICGHEETITAQCVRNKTTARDIVINCGGCREIEREANEEVQKRIIEEQKREKEKERTKRAEKYWGKRLLEMPKCCAECGKEINNNKRDRIIIETTLREIDKNGITTSDLANHLNVSTTSVYRWKEGRVKPKQIYMDAMRELIREPIEEITNDKKSKYCSDKCQRRAENKRHADHRQKVIRANGKAEWDITLKKLVTRDKQVCYICGRKVNMRAHYNADDYGSIDHVIPLSKGGTHTWNNVRLAHRKCNIIKSNKTFIEGKMGN